MQSYYRRAFGPLLKRKASTTDCLASSHADVHAQPPVHLAPTSSRQDLPPHIAHQREASPQPLDNQPLEDHIIYVIRKVENTLPRPQGARELPRTRAATRSPSFGQHTPLTLQHAPQTIQPKHEDEELQDCERLAISVTEWLYDTDESDSSTKSNKARDTDSGHKRMLSVIDLTVRFYNS